MTRVSPKKGRVRYTEQAREQALAWYVEVGPAEAARRASINAGTIRSWARRRGLRTQVVATNQAGVDAARVKAERLRAELRARLISKAVDVIARMDQEHVDYRVVPQGRGQASIVEQVRYPRPTPTGVREYAVAAGILLDKYRLEMGESTDRTRADVTVHHDATDEELERDLARVLRVIPGAKQG